jgi:transmembrane sensor
MTSLSRINSHLADEAAEWIERILNNPSEEDSNEFVEWLCRSPNHIEEFLVAKLTLSKLQNFDPDRQFDVHQLVKSASGRVVALRDAPMVGGAYDRATEQTGSSPPICAPGPDAMRPGRTIRLRAVFAAAVTLVIAASVLWFARFNGSVYSTGVGEQRTIRLADGSYVELNTRSKIRVHLSRDLRSVQLLEGEALFKVAHDTQRPFRVSTPSATIRAVGTQFDVYVASRSDTRVAVVEGRVEVEGDSSNAGGGGLTEPLWAVSAPKRLKIAAAPLMLAAGEQASVTGQGRIQRNAQPDVPTAVAWRNGRLLFNDAPLAEVVKEFSRYNDFRFALIGESLSQRKISGVFHADDPQTLVSLFETDKSLEVTHVNNGVVVKIR